MNSYRSIAFLVLIFYSVISFQGGVEFPTGGIARERLCLLAKGQADLVELQGRRLKSG